MFYLLIFELGSISREIEITPESGPNDQLHTWTFDWQIAIYGMLGELVAWSKLSPDWPDSRARCGVSLRKNTCKSGHKSLPHRGSSFPMPAWWHAWWTVCKKQLRYCEMLGIQLCTRMCHCRVGPATPCDFKFQPSSTNRKKVSKNLRVSVNLHLST